MIVSICRALPEVRVGRPTRLEPWVQKLILSCSCVDGREALSRPLASDPLGASQTAVARIAQFVGFPAVHNQRAPALLIARRPAAWIFRFSFVGPRRDLVQVPVNGRALTVAHTSLGAPFLVSWDKRVVPAYVLLL
jgi:hypothetical protein